MGFFHRLRGLAYGPPAVLLLPRCRSVHTFGMRYPLDLYWLNGDRIVRIDRDVPPGRIRTCRRARSVLEVPGERCG
jgi:uncharacterized membrane protein (UPF0127 family)